MRRLSRSPEAQSAQGPARQPSSASASSRLVGETQAEVVVAVALRVLARRHRGEVLFRRAVGGDQRGAFGRRHGPQDLGCGVGRGAGVADLREPRRQGLRGRWRRQARQAGRRRARRPTSPLADVGADPRQARDLARADRHRGAVGQPVVGEAEGHALVEPDHPARRSRGGRRASPPRSPRPPARLSRMRSGSGPRLRSSPHRSPDAAAKASRTTASCAAPDR